MTNTNKSVEEQKPTATAPAPAAPSKIAAAPAPAVAATVEKVVKAVEVVVQEDKPVEAAVQEDKQPEVKAKRGDMIRAVHGNMHDILTGKDYTMRPVELEKASGWVDAQIAAGKLAID